MEPELSQSIDINGLFKQKSDPYLLLNPESEFIQTRLKKIPFKAIPGRNHLFGRLNFQPYRQNKIINLGLFLNNKVLKSMYVNIYPSANSTDWVLVLKEEFQNKPRTLGSGVLKDSGGDLSGNIYLYNYFPTEREPDVSFTVRVYPIAGEAYRISGSMLKSDVKGCDSERARVAQVFKKAKGNKLVESVYGVMV